MTAADTVLILGGEPDIAATLSRGLAEAGLHTAIVGRAEANPLDRAAMSAAATAACIAAPRLVVLPIIDPGRYRIQALADCSENDWMARCEAPLTAGRIGLQAAYDVLRTTGGRIVLLLPNIAMTGGDGLAAASAVAEGMRSMAKSAARLWGAEGITVNCLAVFVEQLCVDFHAPREPSLPAPSLALPELQRDIAALIALLAAPAAGIITGATLTIDGGALMSI
jgi:3-oxoacyl-[acyl-carrier protein] reductase